MRESRREVDCKGKEGDREEKVILVKVVVWKLLKVKGCSKVAVKGVNSRTERKRSYREEKR